MKLRNMSSKQSPESLKIDNKTFETVTNFTYLGMILNDENKVKQDIKERIQAGNRAY